MDRNLVHGLEPDTSDSAQRRPFPAGLMGRHLALDHPLGLFAGSPRGWRPFGIFQEMERARQPHWHTISLVGCFGVFMGTRQSKFRHVSGGSATKTLLPVKEPAKQTEPPET